MHHAVTPGRTPQAPPPRERSTPPTETGIEGVHQFSLRDRPDARGALTELYRGTWPFALPVCQWNLLVSQPGSLRGMHAHPHHHDFLVHVDGEIVLGLFDLRASAASYGRSLTLRLREEKRAFVIPPGVAHGWYSISAATQLIGLTREWADEADVLIHWADPGLGIEWPSREALLSDRDATASGLQPALEAFQTQTQTRA